MSKKNTDDGRSARAEGAQPASVPSKAGSEAVASIQTVAAQAGVSIATVSRVINGKTSKVSRETQERVLEVARALRYRPSGVGSALRSGRSRLVALLVPNMTNAYHGAIARAVEHELRACGKLMVICNTYDDPQVQDELLSEMRAQLASGFILLGAVESPGLSEVISAGEPVVLVNRKLDLPTSVPFVGIDDHDAGGKVAELLLERDFKHISLVHGSLKSSATADRVNGFLEAIKRSGRRFEIEDHQVAVSRIEGGYDVALKTLRSDRHPDAVFCTTDEIAYGYFKRCRELGLRVTEDIHLFGFDGNPLNDYLAPWLSTISIPYQDFGKKIVDQLRYYWDFHRMEPRADILPFRVVDASSTDGAGSVL